MSPTRRHWMPIGTFSPHTPAEGDQHQPSLRFYTRGKWSPDTDIYEISDGIVIIMDIAGITRNEISIVLENNIITVSGFRKEPKLPGTKAVHRLEIDFGPFEKRFRIPDYIDEHRIDASYENGFLYIHLPRQQSKKIDIE
ncbi:MAG: Hsp20/alpha crystallin family protein [Desulfobacterota bacterium]|nr:Hsp20/alpha crystallin family protein [Thermodesulfobacteriota bacterium]